MALKTKFPALGRPQRAALIDTLSRPRLTKYLAQTRNDEHLALRLYMMNAELSAAVLMDLHFVEIALRNKFDNALAAKFGIDWFNDPTFRGLLQPQTLQILDDAIAEAAKNLSPGQHVLPGKVVSELSFGFWHNLTNKRYTVTLWTPCFRHVFTTAKPLTSKDIQNTLHKLRGLRNRVAHHEPIFHMDIEYRQQLMIEFAAMLCPTTAAVLRSTSKVRSHLAALKHFRRRKRI